MLSSSYQRLKHVIQIVLLMDSKHKRPNSCLGCCSVTAVMIQATYDKRGMFNNAVFPCIQL